MAALRRIACIILVSQVYVSAAPSESAAPVAPNEPTLDQKPDVQEAIEDLKDGIDPTQGQRQKRFFNYYGYGFPPNGPPIYSPPPKRDDTLQTGIYGEDPLVHIYRRLQDIANIVKTPNYNFNVPPPPPLHYPLLVPVFYIPQLGCNCNPNQGPTPTQPPRTNNTDVGIDNRFPEMEDERQNWGFVINETETDDGQDEDFTRPISFDPISPPNRPVNKPAPPVDHGSSQAGVIPDVTTTTTKKPDVAIASAPPTDAPSTCDGAVLSCCHQLEVSYDCFAVQGCPDPTAYGNPCDPQVILRVIDRFQRFYGQRTG